MQELCYFLRTRNNGKLQCNSPRGCSAQAKGRGRNLLEAGMGVICNKCMRPLPTHKCSPILKNSSICEIAQKLG